MKVRPAFLFFLAAIIFCIVPAVWPMARMPFSRETPAPAASKIQRSLTLAQCFDMAVQRSETLAISREELEITKAKFLQATGEAIGDVDFTATDFFQDAPRSGGSGSGVEGTSTKRERRERTITVSQPIFKGFKSLGALTGAGTLRKQRRGEWERTKELLYLDVVRAFYNVLREQKNVEITEGIFNLFEERIGDLRKREEIGRSRTSEVATARAGMSGIEASLAETRGTLANAWNVLAFFVGIPPEEMRLAETDVKSTLPEELSAYVQRVDTRADVQAARAAMKTARRAVIVAQSELWPTVDLENTNYIKREGFQQDIDWDLLFTVNVPIFRGGTTVGKVKESWSEYKQVKYSYSLTRRQAELDIRQNYENFSDSGDGLEPVFQLTVHKIHQFF